MTYDPPKDHAVLADILEGHQFVILNRCTCVIHIVELCSICYDLRPIKKPIKRKLVGAFKHVLFASLFGEDEAILTHIWASSATTPHQTHLPSGMPERPSFAGVADWGGWAVTLGDTYSDGSGYLAAGNLISLRWIADHFRGFNTWWFWVGGLWVDICHRMKGSVT